MTLVLANGVFDIFHAGHVWHLKEARAMGDSLTVALTVDEAVREQKGEGSPIIPWELRRACLMGCRFVDAVVPSIDSAQAIRAVRPNVFVKGIDYVVRTDVLGPIELACKEVGAEFRFTASAKLSSFDIVQTILARRHNLCAST